MSTGDGFMVTLCIYLALSLTPTLFPNPNITRDFFCIVITVQQALEFGTAVRSFARTSHISFVGK